MSDLTNIEAVKRAIEYARGEGPGQYLAGLSEVEKNVAELGARRAISYLQGERLTTQQNFPAVPKSVCAYPNCTCSNRC